MARQLKTWSSSLNFPEIGTLKLSLRRDAYGAHIVMLDRQIASLQKLPSRCEKVESTYSRPRAGSETVSLTLFNTKS